VGWYEHPRDISAPLRRRQGRLDVIDFRYHIVSIVAIFIALAVGIVLGSGPLEDNISGFLEDRTKQLAQEKLALQQDVATLENQLSDADAYAQLVQPSVLGGVLTGSDVVVVLLPGASEDDRKAVESSLRTAGAQVTEEVSIASAWTDPAQQEVLAGVTAAVTRGPVDSDPYVAAGQAVAEALVTQSERLEGQITTEGATTLAAFAEAGFLEVGDTQTVTLASAAVVVTGDGTDVDVATAQQNATSLIPLVSALDAESRGAVVAGPAGSASPTGMVTWVRDSDAADVVSTVDWIDTTAGQTVVPLALAEQVTGAVGHYGTGDGAEAVGPGASGGG
jgi:hypothetical protein